MQFTKFFLIMLSSISLLTTQAQASGGYQCEIEDKNVHLISSGGLSHGIPGSPFNERIEFSVKIPGFTGFTNMPIAKVSQFWFYDDSLNILIYHEPENVSVHSTVTMVIKTKYRPQSEDDWSYVGTYAADVRQGETNSQVKGKVRCWVE